MIENFHKLALISTITCGLVAQVTPASAQRNITCESYKGRYNYCRVDTRGGVTLNRRISNAECQKGRSWGYDQDGIWVDRGCSAEFAIGHRQSNYPNNNRDNEVGTTAAVVTGVVAVAAIAAAIAGSSNNDNHHSSSQSITCSSDEDNYKHCSVNIRNRDRVILKRQLSDSGCWEGNTWGTDRNGIWVDRGCRALFEIQRQG